MEKWMSLKFNLLINHFGETTRQAKKLEQQLGNKVLNLDALNMGQYLAAIKSSYVLLSAEQLLRLVNTCEKLLRQCVEKGFLSAEERSINSEHFWELYLLRQCVYLLNALKEKDTAAYNDIYDNFFVIFEMQYEVFTHFNDTEWLDTQYPREEELKSLIDEASVSSPTHESIEKLAKGFIGYFRARIIKGFHGLSIVMKHVHDKKAVALALLKDFQDSYHLSLRYRDVKHCHQLLKGFVLLREWLDRHFLRAELIELFQEAGFSLKDPCDGALEDLYRLYVLEQSALLGEYTLEKPQDRDYLTTADSLPDITSSAYRTFMSSLSPKQKQALLDFDYPQLISAALLDKPDYVSAFDRFFKTCVKVNKKASEHQRRDVELFFIQHQAAIAQHILLFGLDGIKTLESQLASTMLSLERYCENMFMLDAFFIEPLQQYLIKYPLDVKTGYQDSKELDTLIRTMATLIETYHLVCRKGLDIQEFMQSMLSDIAKNEPAELLQCWHKKLVTTFINSIGVNGETIDIEMILKRMPPERFSKLAAARLRMNDSIYKEVFAHLLYLDLVGGDIDAYLHDIEQEDRLGQSLAEHNQRVQHMLMQKNINPNVALNYSKVKELVIYPLEKDTLDIDNALLVLWSYCESFKPLLVDKIVEFESIKSHLGEDKKRTFNQLKAILRQFEDIDKRITSETHPNPKLVVLKKSVTQQQLAKVDKNLKALKYTYETQVDKASGGRLFTATFMEFLQHTHDQFALVSQFEREKRIVKAKEPLKIRIKQWKKTDPMTSFLGDEVGCCLGSGSGQFPALVQRRMDDAMLFHVAVDLKTNKPVALIWLYLAVRDNGRVVLVANFFEVNAKYGLNKTTRVQLLNALLAFTSDYCDDNPGIDGFYMNELNYGWNMHDLGAYPIVELNLVDKVGGAFIPFLQDEYREDMTALELKQKTIRYYYLASLSKSNTRFHHFRPSILFDNVDEHVVSLQSTIDDIVSELFKQRDDIQTPKDIKAAVIAKKGSVLQSFFDEPLDNDLRFTRMISSALVTCRREREIHSNKTIEAAVIYKYAQIHQFFYGDNSERKATEDKDANRTLVKSCK